MDRRSFLALGVALPVAGCYKVPCAGSSWQNASATQCITPEVIARPVSAMELVSLVREAERHGKRVRMTGTGHSYSDVALTQDYLLLPTGLEGLLPLSRERLRVDQACDPHLVRVGSGSTIRFLNQVLDAQGLALETLGGWDAQTIAGVAMTSTHGSGLAHGPIASQIVSMQLVTTDGEMRQIEPECGITEPKGFPGTLEDDPRIPIKLIQSDPIFQACVVSMGTMGVLYSVTLKTIDRFWMREKRELVSWRDLSKKGGYLESYLAHPRDPAFPDDVEATVCPYPRGERDTDHECLLTQRWRLRTEPLPTAESRTRGLLGEGHILADPFARKFTEGALATLLNGASKRELAGIHHDMMAVLVDPEYVDLSYKVFNLGDINRMRVWGIEMSFSLSQTIQATERMFAIAAEQYAARRHHSVPVTLRFVRASDAMLSIQQGRDTTMMEIGALVQARESEKLLQTYERTLMTEFQARPHWGLDLSILTSFAQVAQLFPRAGEWLKVYKELNSRGTFDGRLTDRLGISIHPRKSKG